MAWQKGKSGNPAGRKKETGHIRELARQYTEIAIKALAEIVQSADRDSARVAAAEALLNRAWGRPEQALSLEGPGGETIVPNIQIILTKREQ